MSILNKHNPSLTLLNHAGRGSLMAILCCMILLGRLNPLAEQGDRLAGHLVPIGGR